MAYFTTNDEVKQCYNTYGDSDHPALILIGGYASNQATWSAQIEAFSQIYFVVTWDRRNHGDSQNVEYGQRITRHGQDLAELIHHLKLKEVILVGHSMGAATIWAYLSLYGDHHISKIVTVDESPFMINQPDWPYGILDFTWQNFVEQAHRIVETKMSVLPIDQQYKRLLGEAYHPFDFSENQSLLINHLAQDWRDVIQQLQIPFLCIAGGKSPLFPPDYAKATAQLNPLGQSAVVNGAGHLVHLEAPVAFNEQVLEFLAQNKNTSI